MQKFYFAGVIGVLLWIMLAGCSAATTPAPTATPIEPTETPTVFSRPTIPCATLTPGITPSRPFPTVTVEKPTALPARPSSAAVPPDLTQTDAQGQVSVSVKPLNLSSPGSTLVFEVSLNTHSVDLSMDISRLARITTDGGKTVPAMKWEGPLGGHHVQGKLSFPAGELSGARKITLTISNVDVPSRVFTWTLRQ